MSLNVHYDIAKTAGATATWTSEDIVNSDGYALVVCLTTTAIGTGSITLTIKGKDQTGGVYYTILAGAAVVTNTTNIYSVGPGLPATANVSANALVPKIIQIVVTHNNANAATYSVGLDLIA